MAFSGSKGYSFTSGFQPSVVGGTMATAGTVPAGSSVPTKASRSIAMFSARRTRLSLIGGMALSRRR